ncbi:MAG: hypothetical protein LC737_09630, partial [Chloroflexi bacterium]|nr:hypothetical protein [Chloroflexota bacterium]
ARQRETAEANARRVYEYLLTHACVGCGESDPVVLEFDHVRGEKLLSISEMIERKYGWEMIYTEIQKRDVCCANCHRRRTAERRGSRRFNWRARL